MAGPQFNGQTLPYEYAYSLWLTEWVEKLTADGNPPCSEELRIVARWGLDAFSTCHLCASPKLPPRTLRPAHKAPLKPR